MPVPTPHETHDATLIAGHAAGDLAGTPRLLAERLLATCEDCTRLHADLRTIAAATRTLPVPAAATRDFRITRAQADRLRRGGVLSRLLRPFDSPSLALRPLAATFSGLGALGLALVLLLPAFGGPAALPAMERAELAARDARATAQPNVDAVPGGAVAGPTAGGEGYSAATAPPGERPASLDGSEAGGDDKGASNGASNGGSSGGAPPAVAAGGASANPATFVLIVSIALLALGLALIALRYLARRFA
jgi:hypothetical protein